MSDEKDKKDEQEPESIETEEKPEGEEEVSNEELALLPHGDFDTCLELGYKTNCIICNHQASREAIFIWYESGKNATIVSKWFVEKHGKKIVNRAIENHFEKHIDLYITKEMVQHEQKMYHLAKKAAEKNTPDQIAQIRQMHWEYILENYNTKPPGTKDLSSKKEHKELSKQFTDLVKSYKEVVTMEWEMLGQGKSEEEQREIMKNYVINSLKKSIEEIKEFPDAYRKLAEKLGLQAPTVIEYKEEGAESGDSAQ